jgi:1-deoxy-D-xylulose-5-phosphate reductoisomerase
MKRLAILGSTGSIGTQTLEVVREHADELQVAGLAAGANIDLLKKQILEFRPGIVSIGSQELAIQLEKELASSSFKPEIHYGMEGLMAVAGCPESDVVVTAVVGMMGIRPTMEAIRSGKDIALANKETLVTAGHLIMKMAEEYGVAILPVDSEHSAIFQSLQGNRREDLDRILLTASGGPFRGYSKDMLDHVTLEQALKHPNWAMGKKITIDSSTMVNKGLEVMEAHWLFDADYDRIQVLIQPQSIIHSMVQYVDGAIIAQLGTPDMKVPIEYALFYPERRSLAGDRLDFAALSRITFEDPDYEVFRGLALAFEAGRAGGTMPTVFNAANEKAVALFLDRKIDYRDITAWIEKCMNAHKLKDHPDLGTILETEERVYRFMDGKESYV